MVHSKLDGCCEPPGGVQEKAPGNFQYYSPTNS